MTSRSRTPFLRYAILPIAIAYSGTAVAAEYLKSVTSEVFQTPGMPREIAARANVCVSQNLAPGLSNAPLIISADLDQGVIVARNALEYPDGLLRWKVRSTFTFEARESRFRIVQTNLERFYDTYSIGWGGIGKWTGSGWKKAETAFQVSASAVAACVMKSPRSEDW